MKRKVAQWIAGGLLSSISILIYLILFQTHLFSTIIVNSLNKYILSPTGISMSGDLEGGLLRKSMGLQQLMLEVTLTGNPLLSADEISVLGWDWDWSTKELTLQNLFMDGYTIQSQNADQISKMAGGSKSSISTIIQNFKAEHGQVSYGSGDTTQTIELPSFHSTLWYIDGFVDTKIHSAVAMAPSVTSDTLSVTGLLGMDASGEIKVNDLEFTTPNQSMKIDLSYASDDISVSMSGTNFDANTIENITLPSWLSDLQLNYDVEVKKKDKNLTMSGKGFVLFPGFEIPFELHDLESDTSGDRFDLTLGPELENFRIVASRLPGGEQSAQISMFRFNFEPFLRDASIQFSEPIGEISIRGKQDEFDIETRIESFMFNNLRFDTLESDFTYSLEEGINFSHGTITQANNKLKFMGKLSKELIGMHTDIDFSDFSFLEVMGTSNKITGDISSHLKIDGNPDHLRLTGDIQPNNLSYDNKLTLTGEGKVDLSLNAKKLSGDIALMGESGFLFGDSLQSYTILGNISEDGYFIEDMHLQGINNMVSISGGYDHDHIIINKLNMIQGENQLKLADTVLVSANPQGIFQLPSSVVTFNNGGVSMEGTFSKQDGYALNTAFELIDVARVLDFFRVKVNFSGITSGSAAISGNLFDPIIDAKLILKDGVTHGYPSDSANVDLRLTSSEVISNNIDAVTAGGSLNLVGKLPWGYKVKGNEIGDMPQYFSILTENYRLRDLNFTSIVGMPISGRATGSLSIRGTPLDTKMDAQLSLSGAAFDTLKFSHGYSELTYEGNLLTFDTLSMVSNWGYGSGAGFMPVSLDLIAQDRLSVASRDMGLDFEFNLSEMPFLSSYISSIDAIQGDFIGTLGFTGPMASPIRNGKIRGHNARLEISLLGNPITNIHAEITVLDNTLIIDHFSGRMNFSEGSNLNTQGAMGWMAEKAGDLIGVNATETYAGEVTATGGLDLTSFFEPRFDIQLKANEVYYRSTDGLIEAIADADLTFAGQDTLNVEAVIPVLRAGYYANFESETSYDEKVSRTDSSLFKYRLNTQFASDLIISNDQMEAEFEGELWLLDYGDEIMRFTGTLTVLEGGKFFYVGNELDLLSGEIIFNSVDFNPQINMIAEIDIEGERVQLILSGDLNEPELVIKAEDTKLSQSDVLSYLTLNKTLVDISLDESALDPVENLSIQFVEKQISKLGREYIGLDLVGVDLASDSTANARLRLGQRLSKNLMITYEGAIQPTDGKTDYDFGFEYQISKNVSVTTKINQNRDVELNGRLKFTY
ncbi:MAG: translocation/assembly module TamB domain-containing protein [FCB group bacterium]|nr:translocation/assembly module TamB domain-containing protein [FCB group bacterium]MBL7028117.1 translocation/assembly module TamB domain-containing protein [Candidatus Neomarinimicrobiota bacterium]MBL7122850.1 translocation/assembly module TamB domain-containing protein [Candidatus Neomarinimicrobiota bacterium]